MNDIAGMQHLGVVVAEPVGVQLDEKGGEFPGLLDGRGLPGTALEGVCGDLPVRVAIADHPVAGLRRRALCVNVDIDVDHVAGMNHRRVGVSEHWRVVLHESRRQCGCLTRRRSTIEVSEEQVFGNGPVRVAGLDQTARLAKRLRQTGVGGLLGTSRASGLR